MSAIPSLRSGQAVTPAPDAGRVAAIRNSLDVNDPAELAAFGDRARREVTASVERLLAEVRTNDLREAADVIAQARGLLGDLDPRQLEPRRGLAGLFDSRGRRLRRFRDQFRKAELLLDGCRSELLERSDSLQRRSRALDGLHEQTRAFILELDAYLDAGWSRLPEAPRTITPDPAAAAAAEPAAAPDEPSGAPADEEVHAPPVGSEAAPAAEADLAPGADAEPPVADDLREASALAGETAPDVVQEARSDETPAAEPSPEDVDPAPDAGEEPGEREPADEPARPSAYERLEARLTAMSAVRTVALRQLALVRMAQNADFPAVARLGAAGVALAAWRADWIEGLGLATRRPRRMRPDVARLARETAVADEILAGAEQVLAATRARRAEAAERMERAAEAIRRA